MITSTWQQYGTEIQVKQSACEMKTILIILCLSSFASCSGNSGCDYWVTHYTSCRDDDGIPDAVYLCRGYQLRTGYVTLYDVQPVTHVMIKEGKGGCWRLTEHVIDKVVLYGDITISQAECGELEPFK